MTDIVINGRFLSQPLSGVQRYAREMVQAMDARLQTAGPEAPRVVLAAPRGAPPPPLQAIRFETLGGPGGHLWEQTVLARRVGRGVLVNLCNSGSLVADRQVTVIHDAAIYRFPRNFRPQYVMFHRFLDLIVSRKSKIATVSDFSRRELSSILSIDPGSIILLPNGSDNQSPSPPDEQVLGRLGLENRRFFLVVGNLSQAKNIEVALAAMGSLDFEEIRLVVVGGINERIFGKAAVKSDARVILAGRVTDSELTALYRAAAALIFPSRYEGFGIPLLEAAVNHCPVVASDIASSREVCGDTIDYFDPDDSEGLADILKSYIADGPDRTARTALAARNAARFTWGASAATLMAAAADLAAR